MQDQKLSILRRYWGFDSFRGSQSDIIDSILDGRDTIGLMATGSGKSLCYQLPALMIEGICVIVSPLIALMDDQAGSLIVKGLKAEALHSGKSKKRQDEILDNCIYGDIKFLFLSPEKLGTELVLTRLKKMQISFFTIDEAHCISQWGHDFRPSYLTLDLLKEEFPSKATLALTATATDTVVKDIKKYLGFDQNAQVFKSSFARPNISISLVRSSRKLNSILHYVKSVPGSKIIYARNKRHCHEINEKLRKAGIKSQVYHADVAIQTRQKRQASWIENDLECMVCTSAFGMGIDKPDVRLVLHYDIPPSLEEYIQETGRAGRDGKLSYAVMLYNNYDLQELEFHYHQGIPKLSRIKEIYHQLGTHLKIPMDSGLGVVSDFELESFLERIDSNKVELKAALQTLEKNQYIRISTSFFTSDRVKITATRETLNSLLEGTSDIAKLIKLLLRNYEGLLYSHISISIESIRKQYNWTKSYVIELLQKAQQLSILEYKYDDGSEKIQFLTSRFPKKNLHIDVATLNAFYKAKKHRYESMVDFVTNEECRAVQLLDYFGEKYESDCGICDYCKGVFDENYNEVEYHEARHLVISSLSKRYMKVDEILDLWPLNKRRKLKSIVERLAEEDAITYSGNMLKLVSKS